MRIVLLAADGLDQERALVGSGTLQRLLDDVAGILVASTGYVQHYIVNTMF